MGLSCLSVWKGQIAGETYEMTLYSILINMSMYEISVGPEEIESRLA